MSRSNHRRCSLKKAFLKNFAIFKEKHLFWSFLFIKLLQRKCFPVNIAKFLRRPIFNNICGWPLLIVVFSSNEEQHLLAAELDKIG